MCGHFKPMLHVLARNRLLTRRCQAKSSSMSAALHYYLGRDGAEIDGGSFLDRIAEHVSRGDGKRKLVLVGENHQDPSAQKLELDILRRISESWPDSTALSLEFYDGESQAVLNEYLADFVDRDTFMADSGGAQSCQGLVDFCKGSRIPVIASNCPRRYSKLVSRYGRSRLYELAASMTDESKRLLPPLPYAESSPEYSRAFFKAMGIVSSIPNDTAKLSRMLDAQSLWDASMAHSIQQSLLHYEVVLHVSGYFHIQRGLGILEHLLGNYWHQDLSILTAAVIPDEDPSSFSTSEHLNFADLVVLSDVGQI